MTPSRAGRDLLRPVLRTIERHELIREGDRVVIAVSGGPDSVALLHLLTRVSEVIPFRVFVAHVDHGLRGAASRADARFVERLAASVGCPLSLERLRLSKTPARGVRDASPESQWREARYGALVRQARRRRANAIALGHHRDDLAETVLMRLIRGAGAHGLAAFGPVGDRDGVRLIRPLYDVTRRRIEAYCEEQGLAWREDASNRDTRRLRNQVRLDLVPFLEREFNPSIREGLARSAEALRVDDEFLEALGEEAWQAIKGKRRGAPRDVPLQALAALPLAVLRRVARRWLAAVARRDYPPTFASVERLVELVHEKHAGACFELERRWRFTRERDRLVVRTLRRASTGR